MKSLTKENNGVIFFGIVEISDLDQKQELQSEKGMEKTGIDHFDTQHA
jgi:hypothetical protein